MTAPHVAVGLRRGRLFVIPSYAPGRGTYVDRGPVREVDPRDQLAVGHAVLAGLADFVDGGELPNWPTYRSPILDAAGVQSYAEYERGLKDCSIVIENDQIHIMWTGPHIYLHSEVDPKELGKAVLTALQNSPQMR